MAGYGSTVSRSTGSDPLVPEPLSPGRKKQMATPDVATMRRLRAQGKAMAPLKPGGRPRFQIANADDLDNAIRAVGRVAEAGRPAVRKFIMARARALGLSSRIPDTWDSSGNLKTSGGSAGT